jgi:serine/threonine protein kinase
MAEQGELLAGRFTVLELVQQESITSTLLTQDSDGRDVLLRELRMASLDNWSTVQKLEKRVELYQAFERGALPECIGLFSDETRDDAAFYIAFERVDGTSIENIVEAEGPQSDDSVETMLREILGGLVQLHHSDEAIVHGGIRPGTIVRGQDGRYRLTELPLPDLPAVPSISPGSSIIDEAYCSLEQRKGRSVSGSDIFSLGMTAVYMLTGKHPHVLPTRQFKPVYRAESTGAILDLTIDQMIEPADGDGRPSAISLIDMLDRVRRPDAIRDDDSRELVTDGGSAVQIRSTATGEAVHVSNPVASRPESLLVGFFLDLWVSKPWLIIIIIAALSAGPLLIPMLIFWFHPKSRSLINRAYARFRDVTLSLRPGSLSVSDQISSIEFSEIDDYRIRENHTSRGLQLEVVLDMKEGKQHRFYMNSLSRPDARKIRNLLEQRFGPLGQLS